MTGQQHVGKKLDRLLPDQGAQSLDEPRPIPVVAKDRPPLHPASDHMIKRPLHVEARPSRHGDAFTTSIAF
jgi:hypothetical protein